MTTADVALRSPLRRNSAPNRHAQRRTLLFVVALGGALLAFYTPLIDAGRVLEARFAAQIGSWFTDGTLIHIDHRVFVQPKNGNAFAVNVSRACSMVGRSVPIGIAAAVFAWPRVGHAIMLSIGTVLIVAGINLARIVATVLVGVNEGVPAMVRFHDWAGTAMTFGSWALVLALLLRLLTSDAKRTLREPSPIEPSSGASP